MATVSLRDLRKSYGPHEVVHGIDLDIADREFVVLVGPSGCGKSTTLRMIAGLEEVSAGEIRIGDTVVNEVEPRHRDIAMVFQDYALYPHMSVFENMAFGLEYRDVPKAEIRRRDRDRDLWPWRHRPGASTQRVPRRHPARRLRSVPEKARGLGPKQMSVRASPTK
ncbi:MAG: ATP-binding cassette domain-containing protein [Alphaproteobacteria bacterium]|nr:ATP-binding cassette domain-containing protein [Alphaproteobacteria bacterium]